MYIGKPVSSRILSAVRRLCGPRRAGRPGKLYQCSRRDANRKPAIPGQHRPHGGSDWPPLAIRAGGPSAFAVRVGRALWSRLLGPDSTELAASAREPHFERRHETVVHEERVGRQGRVEFSWRRCTLRGRARPARGPAFETRIADARSRIGRVAVPRSPALPFDRHGRGGAERFFQRTDDVESFQPPRAARTEWCPSWRGTRDNGYSSPGTICAAPPARKCY